jgi:hypothetical protein
MEKLHASVAALHVQGALGGELSRLHATEFFVAEAKLWAEGGQDAPAVHVQPAGATDRSEDRADETPKPPAAANATDAEALYAKAETLDDALRILKDQLAKNGLQKYAALLTKDSLNLAMARSLRGMERDYDNVIQHPQNFAMREKLILQKSRFYEFVRPIFHEIIKTGEWPAGSFLQYDTTPPPNESFSLELTIDIRGEGYESAAGLPVKSYALPLVSLNYGWSGPPNESEADLDIVLLPGGAVEDVDSAEP